MRVAVVCDWLTYYSGAERVIEQVFEVVGEADVFALVVFLKPEEKAFLGGRKVQTTFIQRLPFARRKFRNYLPLFPFAIEQFDLAAYDLVISCSHAVAKGVVTGPDQVHLCMCYTPMRYAWDLEQEYLREMGLAHGLKRTLIRYILHRLRIWDYASAARVDHFIAISTFIAKRIQKIYRRDSSVIFPPVDIDRFAFRADKEDFYLTASRQVHYKQIHLIAEAFRAMPHLKLVIIGDGPEHERIKQAAAGCSNIVIMGHEPASVLVDHMRRAKAFIFAAREDFGIVKLEAQACGTPVIAYGVGGALDTVVPLGKDNPTGEYFMEQSADSIRSAVERFETGGHVISAMDCRRHAEKFSNQEFRASLRKLLAQYGFTF